MPIAGQDLVLLPQRLQHVVDEVGRLEAIDGWMDLQFRRVGGVCVFLGGEVVLDHRLQDIELALLRRRQVDKRVVLRRRLGKPRQHARLGQVQVMRVGLKVTPRRRLDAIRLAAVEDRVQVHLEDLALGVAAVQFEGQHGLFCLALDGVIRVRPDEELLHQLLADRAATLLDTALRVVGQRGPQHGARVDPAI